MRKVAVYCGTRNLYDDMLVAAKSLILNSSVEKIYFIIEDDNFPVPLPDNRIECINAANQTYFPSDGPNYKQKWTYMVLMRAALTKILPQEDVVLSLDVDTIVDKNIDELWDLPMQNYYIAAAREIWKSTGSYTYINMGVALLNLAKFRQTKLDDEIIYCLNHFHYFANEQDCINDKVQGRILELAPDYNVNDFTDIKKVKEQKIIHFAGIENWQNRVIVGKYKAAAWPQERHPITARQQTQKRRNRKHD